MLVTAAVAAGCGGGSNDSTTADTAKPAAKQPATGNVVVKMDEFAFHPNHVTVAPGAVTISAPNVGKAPHELVLFQTSMDPGSFPVSGNRIDEEGVTGAKSVGEIADVGPELTKRHRFQLKPGKYAMICNVPGHYKAGMYGSLVVK